MRTTSQALINVINDFFVEFIRLEKKYLPEVEYSVVDGKLIRKLNFKDDASAADIAFKLTDYVNNIDKLINEYTQDYFSGKAEENLEKQYLKIRKGIDF